LELKVLFNPWSFNSYGIREYMRSFSLMLFEWLFSLPFHDLQSDSLGFSDLSNSPVNLSFSPERSRSPIMPVWRIDRSWTSSWGMTFLNRSNAEERSRRIEANHPQEAK
jgi:hypothetical protein